MLFKSSIVALALFGLASARKEISANGRGGPGKARSLKEMERHLADSVDLLINVAIDSDDFKPAPSLPALKDIPCGGSRTIKFLVDYKLNNTIPDEAAIRYAMFDLDDCDSEDPTVACGAAINEDYVAKQAFDEDLVISYTFACTPRDETAEDGGCVLDFDGETINGFDGEKSSYAHMNIFFVANANTLDSYDPSAACDMGADCDKENQRFFVGCKTTPAVVEDPHFRTWNQKWYDYMGEGDLTFVDAPYFSPDAAMRINIRTKARYDYSYIESAVMQIGDETLEVGSWGEYFLNGVEGARLPKTIGGFPVTRTVESEKVTRFQVILGDEEIIEFKTYKDWVSVIFHNPDHMRYHSAMGMLGAHDKNGILLGRDGETVFTDMAAFGQEWQVQADEPMLFHVARAPQAPEPCVLPSASSAQRRLGEKFAYEAAEAACTKAGWSKGTIEMCIHDVMATGDLELATAGAF